MKKRTFTPILPPHQCFWCDDGWAGAFLILDLLGLFFAMILWAPALYA